MHRTKFAIAAIAAVLALPSVASAQNADLRVAYVDSEAIIRQAPGYQEASQAFNQTATGWRDTLEQKREQLQSLYDEYQRQEVVLSPEKKTEKQQEIQQLQIEAQQYFEAKFGPEGQAATRQAELMQPIIERVNRVIEEVRRDRGFALIFDLNDGALVAGDPSLNITEEVVQRLNAQAGTSR
ncbi:MAG: OmpH family outer membrane protein [Gemmatimonadetes bacterium]|nr:OmpH family outer membrane protein [Gemmatimonadota bacterium]